jgi:energy-coupling factor transporter ATP-binding protein EcfA2
MKFTRAIFSKYRKLDNINITLSDVTIFIGENNAGKSTALEGINGAVIENGTQRSSRFFSKATDENASVRIFFKIHRQDLDDIFHDLNMTYQEEDNQLIYHEYELSCEYNYKSKDVDRKIVSDKLKEKYPNDERLNPILTNLKTMLSNKVIFLTPNVEMPNESTLSRDIISRKKQFPLNYLFYLQNEDKEKFEYFNNLIKSLFENARLEFTSVNNQIKVKVIQNFRNADYNFDIDEMGDGFRKSLYMIMKIFASDSSVVIVDEPDASMHSKLIKDLIVYLKKLEKQIIVSTHNEIFINEFPRVNLRFIYSKSPVFSEIEDYQKYDVENIFSTLGVNAAYKRSLLLSSHLILLVEGTNDEKYIKLLCEKAELDEELDKWRIHFEHNGGSKIPQLDTIDTINRAQMPIMLIRDRDEYQKEYYQRHIRRLGDRIHFWKRREIENYFMSYNSIYKAVSERIRKRETNSIITFEETKNKIKLFAKSLIPKTALLNIILEYKTIYLAKDPESIGRFTSRIHDWHDDRVIDRFYKEFLEQVALNIKEEKVKNEFTLEKIRLQQEWENEDKLLEMCPGKDLIQRMNQWLKQEYQIEIDIMDLYRNIEVSEIDQDFFAMIEKIRRNCNIEMYQYLHHYTFRENNGFLSFNHHKLYFNSNYWIPCPQFNGDTLYINGFLEKKTNDNKIITTVYDSVAREVIDTIPLDAESTIGHMFYDNETGLLFAAAGIRKGEEEEDSILVIEPTSRKVYKIFLGSELDEGKEGDVGSLIVTSYNKEEGIIYAASVYSQGGNPALYVIKYSIREGKIIPDIKQWNVGRHGPLSLCIDMDNNKIYALSHGYDLNRSLVPVITIIDPEKGEISDEIKIQKQFGRISPFEGSLLAMDYNNHNLLAIAGNELFMINPITKEVRKNNSQKYLYITSSYSTKTVYVVTEEEDIQSSKPYFNTLRSLRQDFQSREIMKFGPEIEVRDITCSNNQVCINASYRERDGEHNFWLFNEL